MKLIVVSGRSGSGKSTALNVLEDLGYYCVDNLPVSLLLELVNQAQQGEDSRLDKVAVSIDARNMPSSIEHFPSFYKRCSELEIDTDVIFLDAKDDALMKRFHNTRRKHPLSSAELSLKEAIIFERTLLEPIIRSADLTIDTTGMTLYELRDQIKLRVAGRTEQDITLLVESFGFKNGVPSDADYVFDVRCLPNPYWEPSLRAYSGLDTPVQEFLSSQNEVREMETDVTKFLEKWIPQFQQSNRSYVTIAIGCTGGKHRSVYLTEKIGHHFARIYRNVQVRHKELAITGAIQIDP